MNVHVSNFFELVKQEWNYPSYEDKSLSEKPEVVEVITYAGIFE